LRTILAPHAAAAGVGGVTRLGAPREKAAMRRFHGPPGLSAWPPDRFFRPDAVARQR
jgi:hypothetical protein